MQRTEFKPLPESVIDWSLETVRALGGGGHTKK